MPGSNENPVEHVLVVDDSRAQRMLLATALKKWGYRVSVAESAQEGLEICHSDRPDLVLSDWIMPDVDGLHFCQMFRALPREHYGYFILLTSKSEKEDIAIGLDAGADDFLTKPVNSAELRARIRAAGRILRAERELNKKNIMIERTLGELRKVYSALQQDLMEARDFQRSLVSDRSRDFKTGTAYLKLKSCGHVGGDLVGLFQAEPTHLGIFAFDVSGHGISSALMGARLAGLLSSTLPEKSMAYEISSTGTLQIRKPAEIVTDLNQLVLSDLRTEHYFTMVLAIIEVTTGRMSFTQAGHPHPLIIRNNGVVEHLGNGGPPVGLLPSMRYETHTTTLGKGDRVLIYSDGLIEQHNLHGEILGKDGLECILQQQSVTPGEQFLDQLFSRIKLLSGKTGLEDDASAVLIDIHTD